MAHPLVLDFPRQSARDHHDPLPPRPGIRHVSPLIGGALAFAFIAALLACTLVERTRHNPRLLLSFIAAAAALTLWDGLLIRQALRQRRVFTLEFVPRKQHFVQAFAHTSIYLYWGWYWAPVYQSADLIAAQLLFAYAFEMLLVWSRGDHYTLGFGPFPIVLSTNLFLWFKQDWFYLQFLMIAVGFLGKQLIRWTKDGRRTHIFNPSSFTLTIFSLALIATGTTDLTWARDIAVTQFYPPHMYLFLFLVALPGQFFFGVTSMTMAAVVTTYLFGVLYFAATGTYYFIDSYIPIAVFLGMHLLFTDPSTAPRTELGRFTFGALYGLSTVALYELLGLAGLPTFYDKLLQVPLLNLLIQGIDAAARSDRLRRFDPGRLGRSLATRQRNLVYVTVWAALFAALSAVQGVGDRHPGQWVRFWQDACGRNRPSACEYLARLQTRLCNAGSGWACNEFALQQDSTAADRRPAIDAMQRGCALGFVPACENLRRESIGGTLQRSAPTLEDYPILLRGSKAPISDRDPGELYARACDEGWPDTCGR